MKKLLFTLALFVLGSGLAFAQTNITATTNVLNTLSVTGAKNLDFGNVEQTSISEVVQPEDAGAGRYDISSGTASGGASIQLQFTALPASLTDGGTSSITTTFATDKAGYVSGSTTSYTAGSDDFDPNTAVTRTLDANGDGTVFIGGEIDPSTATATGTHTGTVTLTVSYN